MSTPGGMCRGHGRAHGERVADGAAAASDVGGHHGLAVAGQGGVCGAEQQAPALREQTDRGPEVVGTGDRVRNRLVSA